uniref:Uncharacterized protein n=1 Tax=Fagus sylvatica TaxID=28930 RepID=A0A2N9HX84_FAGSY
MWKFLSMVRNIWGGRLSEMVFVKDGLSAKSSVTTSLLSGGRGGAFLSFPSLLSIERITSPSDLSLRVLAPTGHLRRVADLERELDEACAELVALCLARVSERESAARWSPCGAHCIITMRQWRTSALIWRLREGMFRSLGDE